MKKVVIMILALMLVGNVAFAGQYSSTKNYKLNQYNSFPDEFHLRLKGSK